MLWQASKDHLVVKKGEQGKLCGTASGLNPLSSCKGSGLKDDIEVSFLCACLFLSVGDSFASHFARFLVFSLFFINLPQPALFSEGSAVLKTTLKGFL